MRIMNNLERKLTVVVFMIAMIMLTAIITNINQAEAATMNWDALKSKYPSGSKWDSSYKNKAWECHGFVCTLADELTGTDPYTWEKAGNLNSIKQGDIIRFKKPHSIMVTDVSGDTITYVDCNWVGKNTVQWDQTIQRSSLTGKFGELDYVMVSPNPIPEIVNVNINNIDDNSITFSFGVKNGTLSKILIESVDTGEKVEKSYTSGLSNISYTFNRSELNNPGTQFRIYLYAYSGSAGNYKNETVHKMTYGSTLELVTFPKISTEIEDGYYRIKSAIDSNYVLDISFGSEENCANLQICENHGGANQIFYIKSLGNGYYSITAKHSGLNLDVYNNGMECGSNIVQSTPHGGANQQWKIYKTSDNYYSFQSRSNSLFMDVAGGTAQSGTNVWCYADNNSLSQKYMIESTKELTDIEEGYYRIKSAIDSNYVLDISFGSTDNCANLEICENHGGNNQIFYVKPLGNGYYSITAKHSGLNLDIYNNGMECGSNIVQSTPHGGANQQWRIYKTGDNYYSFQSRSNSLFMDVSGGVAQSGTNVWCYTDNNTLSQKFVLEKVN